MTPCFLDPMFSGASLLEVELHRFDKERQRFRLGSAFGADGFTPPTRAATPHFQSGEARGSANGASEDFG
ncbi:MAG: hypothetical protein V3T78_04955 [Dehalococcoidia bacterium]